MDRPVPYLERVRTYYDALGYDAPYVWARHDDVPFARLKKPLAECAVSIVTTAALYQPGKGDQGPGAPYNAEAKFYRVYAQRTDTVPDLRISHLAIDRDHTTAKDQNSYFPLVALRRAVDRGRVDAVTPHFFGLPTNRSQRTTREVDCPELLALCQSDHADAVVLVPNCPVCHQSVSLAAHALEGAGLPTVIMGCALDLVEHIGVPRFVFSDFPLGNGAGRPDDVPSQDQTLSLALDLLERATVPRTTLRSPLHWASDDAWKLDYCNVERLTEVEIARRRAAFDRGKLQAREIRERPESI